MSTYNFKQSALKTYIWNRTFVLVEGTLSNGETIDMMRDYWYAMKDDKELKRLRKLSKDKKAENEAGWSDLCTSHIYKCIENIAYSHPSIYEQLGLESEHLVKGQAPIVVVFEKKKSAALDVVNEFNAGHAFFKGQVPTEDVAHICSYLNKSKYNKGYIFVVSDYDPAGVNLADNVRKKVNQFATESEIEVIRVEYGDDPIEEFETYELDYNNTNKKWIDDGYESGVEFNTPENTRRGILGYIEQSMLEHVDKRIFVDIAYTQWLSKSYRDLAYTDDYYKELKKQLEELTEELNSKIDNRKKRFLQKVLHTSNIFEHVTYEDDYDADVIDSEDEQSEDDVDYFESLLGDKNPMTEESKDDLLQELIEDGVGQFELYNIYRQYRS